MKNKILLIVVLILLPFAVISFQKKETNFNLQQKENKNNIKKEEYIIKLKQNNEEIINLNLEDYIIGVVAGEMPASFEEEALKAQAIASRTYAMYKHNKNNNYDVVATTSDQVYLTKDEMKNKWNQNYQKYFNKIEKAVNDTKGLVMKYHDEIIVAYYFAMSNGYTEDAINVFNEQKDYLTSVESNFEEEITANVVQTKTFTKAEFCNLLNISCEKINIKIEEKSPSGRINKININNKSFLGVDIRKILNLRSTDFVINLTNNEVQITTKGYGHGVGMSQYGANAMAKNGQNYENILKHYYQNITISEI